jgi:hypothetical protein
MWQPKFWRLKINIKRCFLCYCWSCNSSNSSDSQKELSKTKSSFSLSSLLFWKTLQLSLGYSGLQNIADSLANIVFTNEHQPPLIIICYVSASVLTKAEETLVPNHRCTVIFTFFWGGYLGLWENIGNGFRSVYVNNFDPLRLVMVLNLT